MKAKHLLDLLKSIDKDIGLSDFDVVLQVGRIPGVEELDIQSAAVVFVRPRPNAHRKTRVVLRSVDPSVVISVEGGGSGATPQGGGV